MGLGPAPRLQAGTLWVGQASRTGVIGKLGLGQVFPYWGHYSVDATTHLLHMLNVAAMGGRLMLQGLAGDILESPGLLVEWGKISGGLGHLIWEKTGNPWMQKNTEVTM